MEVIKNGFTYPNKAFLFKCPHCGCQFTMTAKELIAEQHKKDESSDDTDPDIIVHENDGTEEVINPDTEEVIDTVETGSQDTDNYDDYLEDEDDGDDDDDASDDTDDVNDESDETDDPTTLEDISYIPYVSKCPSCGYNYGIKGKEITRHANY